VTIGERDGHGARLLHASLSTPRLEECVAFYTDVVGLPKLQRPDLVIPGCWLDLGGPHLHLNGRTATPTERPNPRHICIGVPDLAALRETLERHGAETRYDGSLSVPQLWTADPSGNVLEFQPLTPER
jgi:catechol 2,3-dioxygenase-like lactoylglutathione lyase family enzyme